jgi:cadmium resistance protein CadD (predicted permease)
VSSLPAAAASAVALFAATNVDDLVVLTLLSAASRAGGRPRGWEIWAGQYLGFATLVGLSLAAGRGLSLVPARYLWLLALIPLTVGVATLFTAIRAARRGDHSTPPAALSLPAMADPHGLPNRSASADPPRTAVTSTAADPPRLSDVSDVSGVPGAPRVPGLSTVGRLSWMAGVAGVATLTVVDGADNLAAYTPVFATANDGRIALTLAVFAVGVAVWCAAGALLTRHHRITDTLARYGRWILPAAFILIALYTLHTTNAPIHL